MWKQRFIKSRNLFLYPREPFEVDCGPISYLVEALQWLQIKFRSSFSIIAHHIHTAKNAETVLSAQGPIGRLTQTVTMGKDLLFV